MFTIDTHTHIIPKHLPDFSKKFGYGEFITLDQHQNSKAWMMQGNKRFREIEANCWDASIRLQQMQGCERPGWFVAVNASGNVNAQIINIIRAPRKSDELVRIGEGNILRLPAVFVRRCATRLHYRSDINRLAEIAAVIFSQPLHRGSTLGRLGVDTKAGNTVPTAN